MQAPTIQQDRYTISQINRSARLLLENGLGRVWVVGELSNLSKASSGHWYYTLKDDKAQLRCAMFKQSNRLLGFVPENGLEMMACGKISLYEGRGDYQLIVEHLEPLGDGLLQREFEQRKRALQSQGLFDPARKKPFPKIPSCVGLITSPTGAAIRDIIQILRRRFSPLPLIVYPCQVQGKAAADSICQAIQLANRHQQCDALILARGGGSLEDLWGFNEIAVAHAMFASTIPIMTGIGHEVDTTIADYVADLRAPTPSAAAELLSPDGEALFVQCLQFEKRILSAIKRLLKERQVHLRYLTRRLQSPQQRYQQHAQQLDNLDSRLHHAWDRAYQTLILKLQNLNKRLQLSNPIHQTKQTRERLAGLDRRLSYAIQHQLTMKQKKLSELFRALSVINPLQTLHRGYSILQDNTGRVINSVRKTHVGQQLTAKLSDGVITCRVEKE